jgi:hypothetical protein
VFTHVQEDSQGSFAFHIFGLAMKVQVCILHLKMSRSISSRCREDKTRRIHTQEQT